MNLLIPTPTVTPGPEYATQVSDDLEIIAAHRHTGAANGDGYQVPTAGIDINEDLSFQSNNLTSARSVRFADQSFTLAGIGDIGCVYEVNGDLWYNNGVGTPIQITSGSSVITAVGGYTPIDVSNNLAINAASSYILLACDTTSNTITITLPLASAVSAGRFYLIKDASGTSNSDAITVNPSGADTIDLSTNSVVIRDKFDLICVASDGVSNWYLFRFGTISSPFSTRNSPVNVPALTKDTVYVLDVSLNSITVNLPSLDDVTPGVKAIFKDSGDAGVLGNTITITPDSTDKIEGFNTTYSIITAYGEVTLLATTAGWFMV